MIRFLMAPASLAASLILLGTSHTALGEGADEPSHVESDSLANAASQSAEQAEPQSVTADGKPDKPEISNLKSQIGGESETPTGAAIAALVLGNLTGEHMKALGEMLEQDWKDRPEWGDMVVAILKGENMRMGMGWWRTSGRRYDWNWLHAHLDQDQDGKIDRSEMPEQLSNAERLFQRLDRDLDGQVTAADLDFSGGQSMNPAAMQSMMTDQLFYRLDKDSNGRVTPEELAEFFIDADRDRLGFLTPEDLRVGLDDPALRQSGGRRQGGSPPASEMLRMFLAGQLGVFEAGPVLGDPAPDFTLTTHDGQTTVTLSDSFGKKPVVLVFGSFT